MNYYLGLTIIGIIWGGEEILIVPLLIFFGLLGTLKTIIGTSLCCYHQYEYLLL